MQSVRNFFGSTINYIQLLNTKHIMEISIVLDYYWESRLNKVADKFRLSTFDYIDYFKSKNYGSNVSAIIIGLICRWENPKPRIRFSKKEKALYMDIVFDLDQFIPMSLEEKMPIVSQRMLEDIPNIIAKYKFKDFDLDTFRNDLEHCLKEINEDK